MFWVIVGVILVFAFVGLIGYWFGNVIYYKVTIIRNKVVRIIASILAGILVGCLALQIMVSRVEEDEKQWNDGYCEMCGGKYQFGNAQRRTRYGDTWYYYYCEDCGHVIELWGAPKTSREVNKNMDE